MDKRWTLLTGMIQPQRLRDIQTDFIEWFGNFYVNTQNTSARKTVEEDAWLW